MVKRWAIFDLDNTIADINDRLAVASSSGKLNYSKLHDPELIKTDKPIYETIDLMNDLANFNVSIFILTGRFATTKEVTEQWLHTYNVPYDKLVMKSYKDTYMKSDKWKERELHKFNNLNNIILACDDHKKNQYMFESYGIPCLDPLQINYNY
jgi:phosphoglycolate phosphatase-like HAD superfamily hydrolase